jgi:hypothetical protein
MRGNGSGGTESGAEGGPPRMTIPEALAMIGPARNTLDKLAQFVGQQLHYAR